MSARFTSFNLHPSFGSNHPPVRKISFFFSRGHAYPTEQQVPGDQGSMITDYRSTEYTGDGCRTSCLSEQNGASDKLQIHDPSTSPVRPDDRQLCGTGRNGRRRDRRRPALSPWPRTPPVISYVAPPPLASRPRQR